MTDQAGVVARRQLLAAGWNDADIRKSLRRRELAVLHPGVYVDHTGTPSWLQRAWGAVLYAWPAALAGESALRAWDGQSRAQGDESIQVAIDRDRRVRPRDGVAIGRRADLHDHVLWNLGPPRLRYEEAVIDAALAARSELHRIGVLAGACGSRRTTAARLAEAVGRRARVPGRSWLVHVLDDIADGTCSVLEHGYLQRVERAHRLPTAQRQVRAIGPRGAVYRDAVHAGLVVELDGRLFHDSASARDRDLERDLDASVRHHTTVRLGWGQVFDRPCSTASKLGALLAAHGWAGQPRPCGTGCAVRGNIPVTR